MYFEWVANQVMNIDTRFCKNPVTISFKHPFQPPHKTREKCCPFKKADSSYSLGVKQPSDTKTTSSCLTVRYTLYYNRSSNIITRCSGPICEDSIVFAPLVQEFPWWRPSHRAIMARYRKDTTGQRWRVILDRIQECSKIATLQG